VTGATGHIGSHLARFLLGENAEVAALIRPNSQPWRIEDVLSHLHVITGDLSSIENAGTAIREFKPEVVFHLAWYGVHRDLRNDASQLGQNLCGSIELLRLAYESGCRRWIGLGSQAEYGIHDQILTEDLRTLPTDYYGRAKLYVCLLAQKLCEKWEIDFAWLRLTASYGPMDEANRLIPSVILSLLRGNRIALTSGEQWWDYVYVEDAIKAVWKVAITPDAQGIFNLASGNACSIRSIVEHVRDMINPHLPLGFGEVPYGADQIMHLQADISRLRAIGWSPEIDIDEGLRRTVDWFKDNAWRYPS
jgi:nucleoside-diphosphate-sugar epimerase